MEKIKKNTSIKLFIQLAIVTICLLYVFSDIEFYNLLNQLHAINLTLIIPALIIVFTGYIFLALRLLILLRKNNISSFFSLFNASILALGINNLFPLKMGEIAKVIYLNKKLNIKTHDSFSLIIWERFIDSLFLALLGLISLYFYQPNINLQPFFIAVFCLWIGLFIYLKLNPVFKKFTFFLPDLVKEFLHQLHTALTMQRSNYDIILIVLFSVIIWSLYIFQIWFILEKILLIELTLPQLLIVFIVTAIGAAIPTVPGAIGVYEAAMVLALGWFGVDKTEALIAGFVSHAFTLIPSTIITLLILVNMNINLSGFKKLLTKTVSNEVKK